jgi:hypothetical protein
MVCGRQQNAAVGIGFQCLISQQLPPQAFWHIILSLKDCLAELGIAGLADTKLVEYTPGLSLEASRTILVRLIMRWPTADSPKGGSELKDGSVAFSCERCPIATRP